MIFSYNEASRLAGLVFFLPSRTNLAKRLAYQKDTSRHASNQISRRRRPPSQRLCFLRRSKTQAYVLEIRCCCRRSNRVTVVFVVVVFVVVVLVVAVSKVVVVNEFSCRSSSRTYECSSKARLFAYARLSCSVASNFVLYDFP